MPPPPKTSTGKQGSKIPKQKRLEIVVAMFKDPDRPNVDIAKEFGIDEKSVRRIREAELPKKADISGEDIMAKVLENDKKIMELTSDRIITKVSTEDTSVTELVRAGDSSTKRHQLFTGGDTERVGVREFTKEQSDKILKRRYDKTTDQPGGSGAGQEVREGRPD